MVWRKLNQGRKKLMLRTKTAIKIFYEYIADHIIIATGARSRGYQTYPQDSVKVMVTDKAMTLCLSKIDDYRWFWSDWN
jgi:pyruvate/2-oxoglutarate dehydrogenase complex dihydrolipoamide dehydrogenase (E3) component